MSVKAIYSSLLIVWKDHYSSFLRRLQPKWPLAVFISASRWRRSIVGLGFVLLCTKWPARDTTCWTFWIDTLHLNKTWSYPAVSIPVKVCLIITREAEFVIKRRRPARLLVSLTLYPWQCDVRQLQSDKFCFAQSWTVQRALPGIVMAMLIARGTGFTV